MEIEIEDTGLIDQPIPVRLEIGIRRRSNLANRYVFWPEPCCS
jgi:hypothetical protein